jgi:hypothetical protein
MLLLVEQVRVSARNEDFRRLLACSRCSPQYPAADTSESDPNPNPDPGSDPDSRLPEMPDLAISLHHIRRILKFEHLRGILAMGEGGEVNETSQLSNAGKVGALEIVPFACLCYPSYFAVAIAPTLALCGVDSAHVG